jgi:act minimal PKS chain-length factor (CLF/KS beta)
VSGAGLLTDPAAAGDVSPPVHPERTVVTGIGVAAPNGLGTQAFWSATLAGRSGIGRIARFDPAGYPAVLAGEVPSFDVSEHLPGRLVPQTDQVTRLSLMATEWALQDAGADLSRFPEDRIGVVTGNSSGGFDYSQKELQKLWGPGDEPVSAYLSFAWFYAVNTGQVSIRNNLRGPSGVLVSGQAGGLDAVAQARRSLRAGAALMVSGGMDSALCPWGWVAQLTDPQLSLVDDPGRAYLPFDRRATGYVPGEGGAMLILEGESAARARGARAYGEIVGYGTTFDPRPGSGRPPGLRRAAETALKDAGLTAGDIDVVFADAAGVPSLDRIEAAAIGDLFGPEGVPVTAPKTMTGRLYAGGSALDLATALLSIRHGVIPPTVNVTDPDPHDRLDLVLGDPRPARVRTALVLARGSGGFNSAVVVSDRHLGNLSKSPDQPR